MVQLIHNELRKLRRERSLWFALALHLAPWVMVAVASLMGVGGRVPERSVCRAVSCGSVGA